MRVDEEQVLGSMHIVFAWQCPGPTGGHSHQPSGYASAAEREMRYRTRLSMQCVTRNTNTY